MEIVKEEKTDEVANGRRTCGNCAYFLMNTNDIFSGGCRYNPPEAVSIPTQKGNDIGFTDHTFMPMVRAVWKGCRLHATERETELDRMAKYVYPVVPKDAAISKDN